MQKIRLIRQVRETYRQKKHRTSSHSSSQSAPHCGKSSTLDWGLFSDVSLHCPMEKQCLGLSVWASRWSLGGRSASGFQVCISLGSTRESNGLGLSLRVLLDSASKQTGMTNNNLLWGKRLRLLHGPVVHLHIWIVRALRCVGFSLPC